jgi:hypothetical protein
VVFVHGPVSEIARTGTKSAPTEQAAGARRAGRENALPDGTMQSLLNKKKRNEIEWTYFKPGGAAKSIGRAAQVPAI